MKNLYGHNSDNNLGSNPEINNIKEIDLKIGNINLFSKYLSFSQNKEKNSQKEYINKYIINPHIFYNDYESENIIFIEEKWNVSDYFLKEQKPPSKLKNNRHNPLIKSELNIRDINIEDEFDEEFEEEEEEKNKNIKIKKTKKNVIKNIPKENADIFGEEKYPPDDEPIGKPPVKTIELSDIELEGEDELEELEINNSNNKNNNQILIDNKSSTENNLQFSEHIVSQVKSPIDMITIGERVYEICNKKNYSKEKLDLSPLNTYKKDNIIKVQLFKKLNMTAQYNQFLKDGQLFLDDYISSDQKEEVPTAMVVDNIDYKTNCSVWFGTNKSKLIRIPICNKPSKDCQGMVIDTEEVGITSIDCFGNYLIMGHIDGNIKIMENQKIIDTIKDIESEIIQIKFLKINSKKKKYEFIYSNSNGIVNYVKRAKTMFLSRNMNEQILSCKEFPVYKISLFSKEKDLKIIKKKDILISLVSLKNVSLYKIGPKSENQNIAIIEIPYCNIGDFAFDCDFGLGYPPLSDIKDLKEKEQRRQISLIENSIIEDDLKEKILFVVSYGTVIRLFEIKLKSKYKVKINEIGYYITEFPVYRLGFITKSYITIIDSQNCLQLINTFCFKNGKYEKETSQTNNSIITYDKIDLNKCDILKQNNIYFNSSEGKKYPQNNNYLGSVLIFDQNIFIISKQNFLLYKLLRWEEVITNLCQDEEYKKMIWLSTFILGKNKSLFIIESEENEEQLENSLQESLYIFLIKGISEKNNDEGLKMFKDFCLLTNRYKDLYKYKDIFFKKKLESYLYEYTTEFIFYVDILKFEFETDFLKDYINYYLNKHKKILLSKALLKLSANVINKPEILKILEENEIISPNIYAKIKENEDNKSDYFKPILYLYSLFENKIKNMKSQNEEIKKHEYFKLMTEHDMKYYNNKALSSNDYIGHKLLWYINKCLLKEEYPTGNIMPKDLFDQTIKKIFLFLTLDNVMEILLQFDSFSYFIILTKLFTENKYYRIINKDKDKNEFPYTGLESFVKQYLDNISIENLFGKYFYYQIKLFIDGKIDKFRNNIYIKFDFFQMIANICKNQKDIFIDKNTIIDAIKFFINYEILLEGEKSKNYYDPFNCHKIPNKGEILYKKFFENIENNILCLIKSLQNNQDFFEKDLEELFLLDGLKKYYKIQEYLSEYFKKYEELYKVKLEEYKNQNFSLTKEDNLIKFFNWITDTLNLTKKMSENNKNNNTNYYNSFKQFILSRIVNLSKISIKYSVDLIDKCSDKKPEEILDSLDSDELRYAYLNKYLFILSQQEEKDKKFERFLLMKIDLLIKNNYKEQIIKIIAKNRILWKNEFLNILAKNEVYDAAIFISQKRDNIESCIKLSDAQIEKIFNDINQSLLKYNESVNSDIIHIKLEEIKKYLDLALISCASWTEINKNYNMDDLNKSWIIILNLFYKYKNKFNEDNKNNRLGLKFKSNTFESIYGKIMKFLLENIEYILNKMNDYIPVSLTFNILCKEYKNAKFKEYSKMVVRLLNNIRRTEDNYKSILKIITDSLLNEKKSILNEIKRGLIFNENECYYCQKSINYDNMENQKIIFFKCGHIYHNFCCSNEKGQYFCNACTMNKIEESIDSDNSNLIFEQNENEAKNSINEKIIEEKGKKKDNKKNLLNKLNRVKKRIYQKIEGFKVNIDKIQINRNFIY